jgi:ADP-ribose pyrophosphatase YjhB (NUDIX family)
VLPCPAVIQFDQGGHRFTYRIAGIAIHDGKVLLHRAEGETFWAVPGGRAELGETAEQTIRREMQEEVSEEIEIVRLLWIAENFFDYDGRSYHEVALYFLIRFPAGSHPLTRSAFESRDGETKLHFRWCPLDADTLARLPVLPSFLASGLVDLPASAMHVVHRDAN